MSILGYELKKIFSRRAVIVTLAAFLALNIYNLLVLHADVFKGSDYMGRYHEIMAQWEGPLSNEKAAALVAQCEGLQNGTIQPETEWDAEFYKKILDDMSDTYDYSHRVDELNAIVDERLSELEGTGHIYELRRLKLMKRVYSARGIGGYYDYDGFGDRYYGSADFSSFLCVMLLLIAVTPLFCAEHECGMDVLQRTTCFGRQRTVRAKLLAVLIFTTVSALMLFAVDLIYYQIIYPFEMWQTPLCGAAEYHDTPLDLTIGGFILLNWAVKIFGLWVAALVVALISALCRRTYVAFFFSFAYLLAMMALGDVVMMVNPLSLVLFSRYVRSFSTVNVCGYPMLTIVVLPVAMVLLAAALIAAIHAAQRPVRRRLWHWPTLRLPTLSFKSGGGEWRKRLVKQYLLAAVVILLVVRVASDVAEPTWHYFHLPSERAEWQILMDAYGGRSDAESEAFFAAETAAQEADQAQAIAQMESMLKGKEAAPYEKQATVSDNVWDRLKSVGTYVSADPAHRYIADTRGWEKVLCDSAPDVLAVLLAVLFGGLAFSREWESGMADTLRTCRNGRRGFGVRVLAVSCMAGAAVWLLFEAVDFAFLASRYDLFTAWGYPLQTLSDFGDSPLSLTLGQTYLASRALRLCGILLAQTVAAAFSAGTRRSLTAVFAGIALMLVPWFLLKQRPTLYELPNPAGLLCGSGFFAQPVFGAAQWVFLIIGPVLTAALAVYAVETYVRSTKGGARA